MTAEPYEDPEENAERAVAGAYLKVAFRKVAVMWLALFAGLVLTVADYFFAGAALWLLPRPLAVALAAFVAVEFWSAGTSGARRRRATREQRRLEAGMARGERELAALDRLRAVPVPPSWWKCGRRTARFWWGLSIRAVYSASAVLVLSHWLGGRGGVFLAACFTVLVMALGGQLGGAVTRALNAAAFIDPRPPRDTPET